MRGYDLVECSYDEALHPSGRAVHDGQKVLAIKPDPTEKTRQTIFTVTNNYRLLARKIPKCSERMKSLVSELDLNKVMDCHEYLIKKEKNLKEHFGEKLQHTEKLMLDALAERVCLKTVPA